MRRRFANYSLIRSVALFARARKAMEYKVTYPTGETRIFCDVPRYDFNWPMTYQLARRFCFQKVRRFMSLPGTTIRRTMLPIPIRKRTCIGVSRPGGKCWRDSWTLRFQCI